MRETHTRVTDGVAFLLLLMRARLFVFGIYGKA